MRHLCYCNQVLWEWGTATTSVWGEGRGGRGVGTGVVGIYAVTALLNFLLGLCFRNPVHGARFRHCCGFSGVVGSSAVAEMFGSL